MLTYTFTNPSDEKAKILTESLNQVLSDITGDAGRSSYNDDQFNADTDLFLIIEKDSQPLACGAFRYVKNDTCEIKRMFSSVKGLGKEILNILEKKAHSLGYSKIILSTRKTNINAVNFYKKNGYKEIQAYGKYILTKQSICMGKLIDT